MFWVSYGNRSLSSSRQILANQRQNKVQVQVLIWYLLKFDKRIQKLFSLVWKLSAFKGKYFKLKFQLLWCIYWKCFSRYIIKEEIFLNTLIDESWNIFQYVLHIHIVLKVYSIKIKFPSLNWFKISIQFKMNFN